MSASNKKKLRREQEAAKLTEKQLAAQKEAKKTNLYTTAFVIVMAVILVIALVVGVRQTITSHGILEKNTTAVTIGTHELSNAELNYFYMDAVNNFYSNYGSYASIFGMDVTQPLNEQVVDESTGMTWADDFLNTAKENAASMYAMADAAKAAGYTLTEEEQASIDSNLETLSLYATMYGYADADAYLKAIYGNGASEKGYRAYNELNALASSYYNHYGESLVYEDAALREKEAENYNVYSSYDYNAYYMATSKFLTGGTTDADGNTTYSDEEQAAAEAAVKETAETLSHGTYKTAAELDAAIAALSFNADATAATTHYNDTQSSSINSIYAEWVTNASRKAGDVAVFPNNTTSTDENGNNISVLSGYYVVYFNSSSDNTFALKNVRHILVSFEGGTTDESTGATTYSDEEKAAAKTAAEALLAQWESGDATEEAFAALANEQSDDGDGTTGGLYEDIYPGQMVVNFNDWCFDETRKPGDTGIVETEYGYHVMYFVGDSNITYRDYKIAEDLRSADLENWYNSTIDAYEVTDGDLKYIRMDLILSAGN